MLFKHALLLASVCLSGIAFADGPNGSLQLVLTAPAERAIEGKPLRLIATLRNISDHDVKVSQIRGDVRAAYRLTVREQEHMRILQKIDDIDDKYSSTTGRFSTSMIILKPGEQVQESIMIGEFYNLKEPGTYVVQAERYVPYQQVSPYLISNQITIGTR